VRTVLRRVLKQLSYANVTATAALFVALGGTSYAVLHIDSGDIQDNSLRSRDVRNDTLRSRDVRDRSLLARDVRPNSLGGRVLKESGIRRVPHALTADQLGGAPAQDFRLRCPIDTAAKSGVCIESAARAPTNFFGAMSICNQIGRGLVTMPQLDRFARSNGPLSRPEWTGSVYRNPANGPVLVDQLETVLLSGVGDPSYERVYLAVQHAFRCAALPSN
jgi:hypothetical protein